MDKIALIQQAIEKAERFESKLSEEALRVPFLGSLKIRALLNNLGEIGTRFLEIGSHKGGSFCSTIYKNNNLKLATAIDSWASDDINEDKARHQFLDNSCKFKTPSTNLIIIQSDCFNLSPINSPENNYDLYCYDAGHSKEEQRNALIYYKEYLADEFIYGCDDWTYQEVSEGTREGIEQGGYEVLFEKILLNPPGFPEDAHLNDHWWRGYGVFLLKKK